MFDAITNALNKLTALPTNVYDFFTDPIWAVIGVVSLIIALCVLLRYFFPAQTAIWGAGAIGAVLYAVGFFKGQRASSAKENAKPKPVVKPKPAPPSWPFGT